MRMPSACASARAPALYAPRARCPSSLLLAAAIARLEHLFSPSPWLPFLPFARSLVPSRHSNTCSPRRPRRPSCASRARLCRATRTFVFPIAPGCPSRASRALGLLAHAARARRLTTVARATRRLTTVAPRAVLLGLGLARGRVCVRVTCSKKRGRGFLASKKSVV
jgi:hypothetical protein